MVRKYPNLCSPLKVGNITLKNRMVSAPMAFPDITAEGHVTREAAAFYELRAKGGAAAVTLSECIVHIKTGMSHSRHINLQDEGVLAGLTEAARSIKRHGAIANIELSHGGKYADVDLAKGAQGTQLKYGPSAERLPDGSTVVEMPRELIREIVESFGRGAALVKRAGFDMVLVHGGHDWLIQQFLSPASNRRKDEYGGSIENRARLALEVLDSIRRATGTGFPIEFRMSAEEYTPGGYGIRDAIQFARLIEHKVDLLQVSTGSHENSFSRTHPTMFMERGCNVHLASEIKKHVTVPVACIGALNEPKQMEEIIASGRGDVVEMARALLADPFLPRKVMLGKDEEIVKCTRCFTCLAERIHTQTRICSVNPIIGREYENRFALPASRPKKVLVAGGGPAGMKAAATAAERGHRVILCERSGELGGALKFAKHIPFKKDLYSLVGNLEIEMKKAGVDVRLDTEVSRELVEHESPEILMLAVGASPVMPPIPGIHSSKVILAGNISNEAVIGKRIVILGGGQVGCESAVYLAQQGRDVTLVEMLENVARDANARQRPILLDMLAGLHVKIETNVKGIEISDMGLICLDKAGNKRLFEADTIVIAAGLDPLREVVNGLLDAAPEVVEIGDCVKPQKLTEALYRGYHAGLDI
ncbi:MAG: NADH:flavin oxidoreductase, Old yellow enzyme family [Acidobacteria bacterium]|nr:NADH:flavin oxidoreductase, Old yellow enzyme family [Acidobacteriota bacterium]